MNRSSATTHIGGDLKVKDDTNDCVIKHRKGCDGDKSTELVKIVGVVDVVKYLWNDGFIFSRGVVHRSFFKEDCPVTGFQCVGVSRVSEHHLDVIRFGSQHVSCKCHVSEHAFHL